MPKKKSSAVDAPAKKARLGKSAKVDAPVVEKGVAPIPEVKESALKKADSVDIWHGAIFIRSYSLEIHGEEFLDLAKQFLAKHPKGHMLPSDEVSEVVVRYREKLDAELPLDKQNPDAPFVDKERKFSDKAEALAFSIVKKGTVIKSK